MVSKLLQILRLNPQVFSQLLEHFFFTEGQNNFGNKLPFHIALRYYLIFSHIFMTFLYEIGNLMCIYQNQCQNCQQCHY